MGRKKKATIVPPSQESKTPSLAAPSEQKNPIDAASGSQEKTDLASLADRYQEVKTEGVDGSGKSPKKERSAYRSKKDAEALEAETKRADIQSTADAFGDAYCQLLDMLFRRMAEPIPLTEFEREANKGALSRVAAKYIGLDFKYKEEIVLLTVTAVTVAPRFIRSK